MIHQMKLQSVPFEMIKSGEQVIETRLFDEKRSLLNVGDEITFSLIGDENKTIRAKVIELLKYKTFSDLFDAFPPEAFGGKDKEDLLTSIFKYYTKDDENKYGVLGIRVKYID